MENKNSITQTRRAKRKIKKFRVVTHINPYRAYTSPESENLTIGPPALDKFIKLKTFPPILDVGSGFGSMASVLAESFPEKSVLGCEIRTPAVLYAQNKHKRSNLEFCVLNTMQNMLNVVPPNSVEALFICFADPHFRRKKEKRRIVNQATLPEYYWVLKEGGWLITCTDVPKLNDWNREQISEFGLFTEVEGGGEVKNLRNEPSPRAESTSNPSSESPSGFKSGFGSLHECESNSSLEHRIMSFMQWIVSQSDEANKFKKEYPDSPILFSVYRKTPEK